MSFIVYTRGGIPRRKGGIAVGYFVPASGNYYSLNGEVPAELLRPPTKPKPPALALPELVATRRARIRYADLLFALGDDQQCWRCYWRDNPIVSWETDVGVRQLVRCRDCDTLMKPSGR